MQQNDIEITEIQFQNALILPEIVKMMEEGHTVTLRLRGFSMRPFLEDNRDKALMTKAVSPKVGDAVLAEVRPKFFVLHRIIKIDGDEALLTLTYWNAWRGLVKECIKARRNGTCIVFDEKVERTVLVPYESGLRF